MMEEKKEKEIPYFGINQIFNNYSEISELNLIKVYGWVKSFRQGKKASFITINDGSTIENLQIVSVEKEIKFPVQHGAFLFLVGKLILTPKGKQKMELRLDDFISLINSDKDYPLQKNHLPLSYVRNYPHLRAKTYFFSTVFRLRSSISRAIHNFFEQEGFHHLFTPILTENDTEGGGEIFRLKEEGFFVNQVNLTVSGQLELEALTQGLGKVYNFSPCFRAEKSDTFRHLAEFWMIEAEMITDNLSELMDFSEKMLKSIISQVLGQNSEGLKLIEVQSNSELIFFLSSILKDPFVRVEYKEVLEILRKNKGIFSSEEFEWGFDLKSIHEKFICDYFGKKPVFITNYPSLLKAFYMKNNEEKEQETVFCFDLLLPKIGELVGGSLREDNYELLLNKIKRLKMKKEKLEWYLDLRRSGYGKTGGFGLGFERLIMLFLGDVNIRDTIPFPRYFKNCQY